MSSGCNVSGLTLSRYAQLGAYHPPSQLEYQKSVG
jgi:hypothetical protein